MGTLTNAVNVEEPLDTALTFGDTRQLRAEKPVTVITGAPPLPKEPTLLTTTEITQYKPFVSDH